MSFSADVKAELSKIMPEKDHCVRAELSAFLSPEEALADPELVRRPCCISREDFPYITPWLPWPAAWDWD